MTCCSIFVVTFFLLKNAPIILDNAWNQKPLFSNKYPFASVLNLIYKILIITFSVLKEIEVMYYIAYGAFAILGTTVHPFFFAFHMSVILLRYPVMRTVVKSFSNPKEQLLLTLSLIVILTYIFALIAYIWYQPDFTGFCHTVWYCFSFIFDFNIKIPGGIGGQLTAMYDGTHTISYSIGRYLFDNLNNLLIPIIVVAIVAGLIIDTFGSLREEEESKSEDIEEKCFICGNNAYFFNLIGSFSIKSRMDSREVLRNTLKSIITCGIICFSFPTWTGSSLMNIQE